MFFAPEDLLKILLAVVVGGAIGIEREFRDKAAGFRTLIFICLGATLFTMFSLNLAGDKDPTRIASAIVSGVGFLGAGVILREGGRVIGLTTSLHHLAYCCPWHGHRRRAVSHHQRSCGDDFAGLVGFSVV